MKAIQIISQDLFDKIRSRFQNLEMGDETGAVTIDPAEARFFDFDFINEGVNLGRVSISLGDLGSLKIYYSQGITENQDTSGKKMWYSFLKEMRLFAMRRLLRFDTRDIAKSNLDKNDFQHLAATQGPKEEPMNMNESRWTQKSSKKTSRAVKGATEVIVRHHKPVDEMFPGSRSQRKNIRAIFIQNKDGERFKYPFIHPAGAFAMAQHVDHGGVPHDPAGKAIVRMSEQIAQLQEFQRQVQHTQLHDDAMGITERAVGRLHELKAQIEALSKRHHYESWISEFQEQADPMLGELDAVTLETYKQKFTQSSFNEHLASLFPLIHSIMQETNTVDLESYVSEGDKCDTCHKDPCQCDDEEVKENAFNQFAEWAEAVEQGKLTDDQIEELKQAISDLEASGQSLELGPQGQTAWQFFSGLGLTDGDLEQKLTAAADLDPAADPIEIMKMWAQQNYPELLVALGISSGQPQAQPEPQPEQPVAEAKDATAVIGEVAKIVKSFYNRDNPEVGPFRGEEGIALDVSKKISEMFGEKAGQQAEALAKQFMKKLTNEWETRHGRHAGAVDDQDGLARLKELLGNVKTRVEAIDPKNPRDYEIPAYQRKEKGQEPLTTKDISDKDNASPTTAAGLAKRKAELGMTPEAHNDTFDPKSHAYKTTMKHADNPTVQQRMAAHDIKPGIAGYRDRIDMLKDLERTGKLKNTQEGSGPKEKQKTPYRDINSPEYRAAADKQKEKMTKDKAAEPGKELAKKIDQKKTNESEITAIRKLAGLAK